jgi:3-isopropylmalate/(R)-2-methylmalate dehydratase small subunit
MTTYPYSASYITLPAENVDTDQIIPARFLKTTDKTGLGALAFHDWRYDAEGAPRPEFVLNRPEARDAHILVAGHNFGCGSSREHAPWALLGAGITAVVSSAFADIFKNNSIKNGLLPVEVEPRFLKQLLDSQLGVLTIDLDAQTITSADGQATFPIDPFAKHCLRHGVDQLGFLLDHQDAIAAYEMRTTQGSVSGTQAAVEHAAGVMS